MSNVAELFEAAGFFPLDLGGIAAGDACRRVRPARSHVRTWCTCREPGRLALRHAVDRECQYRVDLSTEVAKCA
jgi:hypothetical protein